jgi:hypothetical protein
MKFYRISIQALPAALALLLCSCWAYSFSSSGLSGVNSIAIVKIDNNTPEYGLEDMLIQKINSAFESDHTLKVVPVSQADLLLTATISRYSRDTYIADQTEAAKEYKCTITLNIKIYQAKDDKVLWEDGALTDFGTYSPDNGESQDDGDESAVDKLIIEIMNRTVRNW